MGRKKNRRRKGDGVEEGRVRKRNRKRRKARSECKGKGIEEKKLGLG